MRKTKIVCTLGPATDKEGVLEALVQEGMNVARLNFSHGSHEEHEKRIRAVVELSRKANLPVAVLLDTKGPEIRTGELKEDKVFRKTESRLLCMPKSGWAMKRVFQLLFLLCVRMYLWAAGFFWMMD